MTPTVNQEDATVTVNGEAVASATASDEIALEIGANRITVRVTAQNGATQDYTITVTRGLPTIELARQQLQGYRWKARQDNRGCSGCNPAMPTT